MFESININMNDFDQELLYDRDGLKTTEFWIGNAPKSRDSNFKGIDISLLGFQEDGIIENEIGDNSQHNDDLYSTYGRRKSNMLVDQPSAAVKQGHAFNQSILSSKPPLLEIIKNNLHRIIGLNSASVHKNNEGDGSGNGGVKNAFSALLNPKSSEIKLLEEGSSIVQKPPMVPKFVNKQRRDSLEPPTLMMGSKTCKTSAGKTIKFKKIVFNGSKSHCGLFELL
jgi:hypothetical protein